MIVSEAEDSVKVSPVLMVLLAVSCADHRKLPAEAASQNETWEMTSPLVPAQLVHDGEDEELRTPVVAVVKVMVGRVVTEDTEVVPIVPGFAVCS